MIGMDRTIVPCGAGLVLAPLPHATGGIAT
jgi:hypothetical protein